MSAKGVLVISQDKSGNIVMSSSALLFDDIILLHGSHISPLLKQEKWNENINSIFSSPLLNREVCNFVDKNLQFSVVEERDDDLALPESVERIGRKFVTAAAWRCPLVEKALSVFKADQDELELSCLSIFILLKNPGDDFIFEQRISLWLQWLEIPVRGGNVIIESTPTGRQAFINSWSRGVVSRLFWDCIFLTDATVQNCAGAPIYNAVHTTFDSIIKGSLLGVVIARCSNFTWAIVLHPVLSRAAQVAALPPRVLAPQSNLEKLVDETVGAISSGDLRGTGVVVDAGRGVVITCSHVIENYATTVNIYLGNNAFTCDVIYRIGAYDLAVLKITPKSFLHEHMEIAETPAQKGDTISLAGFPYVVQLREDDIRPFISFGCVSKSLPHVIVCSCSIAKGNSGGPIIRGQKLLGLVSFIETGESSYGFAVPATLFRDQIRKYIETDDVLHLKTLESTNESVKRFWKQSYCKL